MKRNNLICVLLAGLFCLALPVISTAQGTGAKMQREILRLVNQHRAEKGLPELVMNEKMCEVAEEHSRNMAAHKVPMGHDGFEERVARLSKAIKPVNASAENVAEGVNTAEAAVSLWLHSPGHRKNIEGKYNLTGIGIAKSKDGSMYYTQIFMHKQ